jgi:hypothetical protein
VEVEVAAGDGLADDFAVADVALEDADGEAAGGGGEVLEPAPDQVVQDTNLGGTLVDKLVNDVGPDRPGPARHQDCRPS